MFRPMDGAPDIYIELKPSPTLAVLLTGIYALCVISLAYLPLALPIRLPVMLLVALHGLECVRRYCFPGSRHWIAGLVIRDQAWLQTGAVRRLAVELQAIILWRWLIVIQLQEQRSGSVRSLVIARDSCSAEHWRQLRVSLRHCLQWQSQ